MAITSNKKYLAIAQKKNPAHNKHPAIYIYSTKLKRRKAPLEMTKDISNYCCLAFDRSEEDKWLYALTEGRNDEGKA